MADVREGHHCFAIGNKYYNIVSVRKRDKKLRTTSSVRSMPLERGARAHIIIKIYNEPMPSDEYHYNNNNNNNIYIREFIMGFN